MSITVTDKAGNPEDNDFFIKLTRKLTKIFGFDESTALPYDSSRNVIYPKEIDPATLLTFKFPEDGTLIGRFPASLIRGIPDKMFVYCDICEPYVTGDVKSPLLRVVPTNSSRYVYGSTHTTHFGLPNYIPLLN